MAIFKTISLAWPFFKEMVVKNTSLRAAVHDNKVLTFLFTALVFSLVVCYYLATLTIAEHTRYTELAHEKAQLVLRLSTSGDQFSALEKQHINTADSNVRLLKTIDWLREENDRQRDELDRAQARLKALDNTLDNLRQQIDLLEQQRDSQSSRQRMCIQDHLDWLREQEGLP